MTLEAARNQFPHLAQGLIYMNHATISPLPTAVRRAVDSYYEHRATKSIDLHPWVDDLALQTKSKLARILHTKPERIAFTHNTADAVSILSSGIQWNDGDRVLLYKYEYPANVYPYLLLKQRGVEIDFVEPEDSRITLDIIRRSVTPKTKLIALSLVQSVTGFQCDAQAIGKFCKERNIIFALDAIQALPQAEIDVEKANVDFMAVAVHKWLMGSEGTAPAYFSERLQKMIRQISMGTTSVENPDSIFDYDVNRIRTDAGRYETGMLNYPGIAALNAALDFQEDFGFDEVRSRIHEHSAYLISTLKSHGVSVLTPEAEHERSGIVTCEIEEPDKVNERLKKKNIIAKVVIAMGSRKLRFSPHFYNTEEELRLAMNTVFA
ncbi:MAG: aminotransferase class V-fold PLP-dependent enzyme [Ignavibacteriota bacterium]